MSERTAALLLARGPLEAAWRGHSALKYKALVPVNGLPMAGHVLGALHASQVSEVFIVQGADEGLEHVIGSRPGDIFINCADVDSGYSGSLYSGFKGVVNHYGVEGLRDTDIMVVPCDVPLANCGNFDRLIRQYGVKECDLCFALIQCRLLRERYPGRSYRGFQFRDLPGSRTLQNIAFISGRLLGEAFLGADYGGPERTPPLATDIVSEAARKVDALVSARDHALQVPHMFLELFRLLAARKQLGSSLLLLCKLLGRSYSTADAAYFVRLISGLSLSYIESQEAELSFDIDLPAHLDRFHAMQAGPGLTGGRT